MSLHPGGKQPEIADFTHDGRAVHTTFHEGDTILFNTNPRARKIAEDRNEGTKLLRGRLYIRTLQSSVSKAGHKTPTASNCPYFVPTCCTTRREGWVALWATSRVALL